MLDFGISSVEHSDFNNGLVYSVWLLQQIWAEEYQELIMNNTNNQMIKNITYEMEIYEMPYILLQQ
jgi:hypothetical protein